MAERGTCSTCGDPAICGKDASQWYICQRCNSEKATRYREAQKDRIFELLGEECVECGFDDRRALQIDHLNGGGRQHRMSMNGSPTRLYRYVLDNPDEFQILCANCNTIKRIELREHGNMLKGVV